MQRRTDEARQPVVRRSGGCPPADADVPLAIGTGTPAWFWELVRSLRLHQCVKNLLVFVPLILGGRLSDRTEVLNSLVAFVALTCVASGTYLINESGTGLRTASIGQSDTGPSPLDGSRWEALYGLACS